MISRNEAFRLKEQLLSLLEEDAPNQERILDRLEGIRSEKGIEAHSALLLILTGQGFEEDNARRHWEAILRHREAMGERIGRDVGLRVAAFDYFVNVNRMTEQPRLIDLHITDPVAPDAVTDPLTQLLNAAMFRMSLLKEVRRSRRYGPGFVVAQLDLDGLDDVNRRYGSLVVDGMVRETAMIIAGRIRDIDSAARLGGGQFAVLLPESDRAGGYAVCERIRSEVETFFRQREAAGRVVGLTISAGLAKFPEDGTAPEEILEHAGHALHLAKSRGKNAVAMYVAERRGYLRLDVRGRSLTIRTAGGAEAPAGVHPHSASNVSRGAFSSNRTSPTVLARRCSST